MTSDTPPGDGGTGEPAPSGPVLDERAPAVVVLRLIQPIILEARKDPQHKANAENGMRVLIDVQRALAANPADASAVGWLRQLALTWNTRVRGSQLKFRRIFDLLDEAAKGGRR